MKTATKFFNLFRKTEKKKRDKLSDLTPRGVISTVVPQEYLDKTKVWDSHLFKNIKIV